MSSNETMSDDYDSNYSDYDEEYSEGSYESYDEYDANHLGPAGGSGANQNSNADKNRYQIFPEEAQLLNHVASLVRKLSEDYFYELAETPGRVILLLCKFNWDTERLVERYLEDPERVLKMANVAPAGDIQEGKEGDAASQAECQVCFDSPADCRNPLCSHAFCRDCYACYWLGWALGVRHGAAVSPPRCGFFFILFKKEKFSEKAA